MTDLATVDYFSDHAISQDPYEYWDHMREQGPVAIDFYSEWQTAYIKY